MKAIVKGAIDYLRRGVEENLVKPGLVVEGKNYDDLDNTLDIFNDRISVRADTDLPEKMSDVLKDPLHIILDPNNPDPTNLARFVNRLHDNNLSDPESIQAVFRKIENIPNNKYKKKFKKLNIEKIVSEATPEDIQNAILSAFNYSETGKIDPKNLVLNIVNAVNLAEDFRFTLNKQIKTTDPRQKAILTKNVIARFMILREISGAVNHQISTGGQIMAISRHSKGVFDLDYDTTLRNMLDMEVSLQVWINQQ